MPKHVLNTFLCGCMVTSTGSRCTHIYIYVCVYMSAHVRPRMRLAFWRGLRRNYSLACIRTSANFERKRHRIRWRLDRTTANKHQGTSATNVLNAHAKLIHRKPSARFAHWNSWPDKLPVVAEERADRWENIYKPYKPHTSRHTNRWKNIYKPYKP